MKSGSKGGPRASIPQESDGRSLRFSEGASYSLKRVQVPRALFQLRRSGSNQGLGLQMITAGLYVSARNAFDHAVGDDEDDDQGHEAERDSDDGSAQVAAPRFVCRAGLAGDATPREEEGGA
jgi:hypothetical protein